MLMATQATDLWSNTDPRDLDFSEAAVQIYGPQAGTLAIMRDVLRNQGFRKITAHTKVEQFQDSFASTPVDLVIVDVDQRPAEVCNLVRDIRFRRLGKNPFVSVLVLSGGIEKKKAPLVLNSGTDDILLSPMSTDAVRSRLHRLVQARAPFVGTPAYIGPDRRSPDRAKESDVPLLVVPNALSQKATRAGSEPIDGSIEQTYRAISRQQVGRMGMAVRTTALNLQKQLATRSEDHGCKRLKQLYVELADLTRHLKGQGYDDLAHMLDLTKTAVSEAMQAGELNLKRLEVLRLHGDSLLALLRSNGTPDDELETGLRKAAATVRPKTGDLFNGSSRVTNGRLGSTCDVPPCSLTFRA